MEVLYPNCAGLDVHKDTVVACSRRMTGSKVEREVRTFATTTSGRTCEARHSTVAHTHDGRSRS